ncbi:XdhC family protein (plasmid) [Pseudomonas sp. BYT-5]|uniref:XdhC family protein n=1 Tax=Pseudomonas sp. BYT-5 TaxID=2944392 RepID=UPI002020389F|nr:XdhC family protein [Pseudomonas sp. BYT-5]URD45389.1 XdhC family protein [Pseudomonas sp. BYT-5]
MEHLDLKVVAWGHEALRSGRRVWLCTVLSTYGSAPREPGSMLIALEDGTSVGSLSGGCVEEHFLQKVKEGVFRERVYLEYYGADLKGNQIELPCGGTLAILVERLEPTAANIGLLASMQHGLQGGPALLRKIGLADQACSFDFVESQHPKVKWGEKQIELFIGACLTILIAGYSPVAEYCADFALALGMKVIICEPRDSEFSNISVLGVNLLKELPARFIAEHGCHSRTAIVALTHDPRIDDLTMMEAVRTEAFYIGAMGSTRTSDKRMERLRRIAGFSEQDVCRLHAPIGLNIGSKTPAQIALAIIADIVRESNDIAKVDL